MNRARALRLAGLVVLVAAALLWWPIGLLGGDDSDDDYETQVEKVGQTLEETFTNLGASISGSGDTREAGRRLQEGARSLDEASTDLAAIEPPSEIAAQHEQLVSGLAELADEFRTGARAAQAGDLDKLLKFASTLQSSAPVRKITSAGREIESKGYRFRSGGGGGGG